MAWEDVKTQVEQQGSGLLGYDWKFPTDWETGKTLDDYLNMVKGSEEYQNQQNIVGGAPELTVPSDAYPWSRTGLPQWGLDTIRGISGQLPGLLGSYNSAISNLEQVPALVDDWVAQGGKAFLAGLNPFQDYLRTPFEKANARGLGDSTLTRDIAVNLGGLLADDYRKQQADTTAEGLKLKAAVPQQVATLRGQAFQSAANLLGSANVSESENKLAQFEAMLNALLG